MAPTPSSENVTALLVEAGRGDQEAVNQLWELVYHDLRRIAHRELYRRRPGRTIQTTALVNEAYIRLVGQAQAQWQDRLHFFAFAAKAMRHVLIDYARRQSRQKRGGGRRHLALDDAVLAAEQRADTFLALDEALTRLGTLNERLAQVVEYRFFGGMTDEEIAALFQVSDRTVRRDWRKAKAWLADALAESREIPPAP